MSKKITLADRCVQALADLPLNGAGVQKICSKVIGQGYDLKKQKMRLFYSNIYKALKDQRFETKNVDGHIHYCLRSGHPDTRSNEKKAESFNYTPDRIIDEFQDLLDNVRNYSGTVQETIDMIENLITTFGNDARLGDVRDQLGRISDILS